MHVANPKRRYGGLPRREFIDSSAPLIWISVFFPLMQFMCIFLCLAQATYCRLSEIKIVYLWMYINIIWLLISYQPVLLTRRPVACLLYSVKQAAECRRTFGFLHGLIMFQNSARFRISRASAHDITWHSFLREARTPGEDNQVNCRADFIMITPSHT